MISLDLLGIFSAGVMTFLSPCVLPLIPVYLAALTGGDFSIGGIRQRGALLFRAAFFAIGFILVFTLMGLGASSIGAFLAESRMALQAAGAILITLFALKFLDIIQIPFMDRALKADDTRLQTRFGSLNALILGVLFAAGWSPCVGPILGSVLTYTAATAADPWTGALYLSLFGFGVALPLLLTAVFAQGASRFIARLSPFLGRIQKAFGVILLIVVFTMISDIGGTAAPSASPDCPEPTFASVVTQTPESTKLPILLELYRQDCPVCRQMKPIMNNLVTECDENGVRVMQVNLDLPENRHLVGKHRLVGVPTFLFLDRQGNEVARLIGKQSEDTLKQTLAVIRGEPCPNTGSIEPADCPADTAAQCGVQATPPSQLDRKW
jgi:cytochrome c-type biogenesis protein